MAKLVRDKIPQIIENKGENCEYYISDDKEYYKRLTQKLLEESQEIIDSKNEDELKEELSDLYEVIDTIIRVKKLSYENIKKIQLEKKNDKGGFEKKIILTKY